MKKISFLYGEGGYTLYRALIELFCEKKSINIVYVASSHKEPQFKDKLSIPKKHFNFQMLYAEKTILSQFQLLSTISKVSDYVYCIGYLKIIPKEILDKYPNTTFINIHPSLLPKYKGLDSFDNSLSSSDEYIGSTLHYINDKLDDGEIISSFLKPSFRAYSY